MVKIAPSMLSADFLHLGRDVETVNANADLFHLDIMDGTFVPNISYGFPVVEAIARAATLPIDAHLMIVHPEKYVERFAKAGVRMLSFHYEAAGNPLDIISLIRDNGMVPGIAVNPDVPVEVLFPYIGECGYMVLMSVFAGFGGQKFIETTYGRVKELRAEILRQGAECTIEVDGGVSPANSKALEEAGADILVAGSAVFRAADPAAVIRAMKSGLS